jgi:hypothetical protein
MDFPLESGRSFGSQLAKSELTFTAKGNPGSLSYVTAEHGLS